MNNYVTGKKSPILKSRILRSKRALVTKYVYKEPEIEAFNLTFSELFRITFSNFYVHWTIEGKLKNLGKL